MEGRVNTVTISLDEYLSLKRTKEKWANSKTYFLSGYYYGHLNVEPEESFDTVQELSERVCRIVDESYKPKIKYLEAEIEKLKNRGLIERIFNICR